ncbi:Uncharacterised protein [Burkholderia pseudomallei]|nr:Uncharacterised protein [Burkholderia pseudomallei]CAJ8048206.1 Uncharacterised protein [Burkholderia pseudomallei]
MTEKDNIKQHITLGLTAFLDILGFGARVAAAEHAEDVAAIAQAVEWIQEAFEFRGKESWQEEVHAHARKTVLAFSDSVVVHVPLVSDATKFQGTFDPFLSEIYDLAIAQAACVARGLFLRGGLDLGWWYRNGDVLVSQGLARAYRAEGLANVPVIALTEDIYQYLSEHPDRANYAEEIEPLGRLLRHYTGPRSDGTSQKFWFIDYIGTYVRNVEWQPGSREQLEEYKRATPERKDELWMAGCHENQQRWLAHHARTIEAAFGRAGSPSVAQKYRWLSLYHNEIALQYGFDGDCLCRIS